MTQVFGGTRRAHRDPLAVVVSSLRLAVGVLSLEPTFSYFVIGVQSFFSHILNWDTGIRSRLEFFRCPLAEGIFLRQ